MKKLKLPQPRTCDLPITTGVKIGKLTAVRFLKRDHHRYLVWEWQCECGNKTVARSADVKSGNTRSCGCLAVENLIKRSFKHGCARRKQQTPEYMIWGAMIQRATNKDNARWEDWGGRGIKVCERWLDFKNFIADMGPRPPGLTLERRDNDKDYSPENCYWATWSEQNKNKRR